MDEIAGDALARLYAASLDDFVRLRRAIAEELRAAGHAASARRVGDARKPSRTVWALNQVARQSPDVVRAVLDAYAHATGVQERGESNALRAALDAHRARLGEALRGVRVVMGDAGMPPTPAQLRKIGETLQVAATDDAVRRALLDGRLEEDAALDDPFASVASAPTKPTKPTKPANDAEAKKRAAAAERAERAAAAERARAEEKAQRERRAIERALEKARGVLARAEAERERAAHEVDALAKKLDAATTPR